MKQEHAFYKVSTTTERDALLVSLASQLTPGLTCYVISEGKYYELDDSQKWVVTTGPAQTTGPVYSPLALTITSAGGAVATEVVRLASAGVLAKAQADTAAHAAAVIGVYDGTSVVPIHEQPIAKFDSAPVVGQPCYLSATVAGAMTSTLPISGAITMPPNAIVLADKSVGAAYAARIGVSSAIVSPLSLSQQFIEDSAAKIGVAPNTLRSYFDDFNALAASGFPAIGAIGGVITPPTALKTTPAASTLDFSTSNGSYPTWTVSLGTPCSLVALNQLIAAALSGQKWAFATRVKTAAVTATFKFWLDRGAGYETVGIGVNFDGADKLVWFHGDCDPLTAEPSGANITVISDPDTAWHIVSIWSTGDGSVRFQLDGGTVLVKAMPVSASSAVPRWKLVTEQGAIFDYWAFCSV